MPFFDKIAYEVGSFLGTRAAKAAANRLPGQRKLTKLEEFSKSWSEHAKTAGRATEAASHIEMGSVDAALTTPPSTPSLSNRIASFPGRLIGGLEEGAMRFIGQADSNILSLIGGIDVDNVDIEEVGGVLGQGFQKAGGIVKDIYDDNPELQRGFREGFITEFKAQGGKIKQSITSTARNLRDGIRNFEQGYDNPVLTARASRTVTDTPKDKARRAHTAQVNKRNREFAEGVRQRQAERLNRVQTAQGAPQAVRTLNTTQSATNTPLTTASHLPPLGSGINGPMPASTSSASRISPPPSMSYDDDGYELIGSSPSRPPSTAPLLSPTSSRSRSLSSSSTSSASRISPPPSSGSPSEFRHQPSVSRPGPRIFNSAEGEGSNTSPSSPSPTFQRSTARPGSRIFNSAEGVGSTSSASRISPPPSMSYVDDGYELIGSSPSRPPSTASLLSSTSSSSSSSSSSSTSSASRIFTPQPRHADMEMQLMDPDSPPSPSVLSRLGQMPSSSPNGFQVYTSSSSSSSSSNSPPPPPPSPVAGYQRREIAGFGGVSSNPVPSPGLRDRIIAGGRRFFNRLFGRSPTHNPDNYIELTPISSGTPSTSVSSRLRPASAPASTTAGRAATSTSASVSSRLRPASAPASTTAGRAATSTSANASSIGTKGIMGMMGAQLAVESLNGLNNMFAIMGQQRIAEQEQDIQRQQMAFDTANNIYQVSRQKSEADEQMNMNIAQNREQSGLQLLQMRRGTRRW